MVVCTLKAITAKCRKHGSKFSAFVTDTNDSETMGFLLAAVHSNVNTRTDSLNAFQQTPGGPQTYPFDTSPSAVPNIDHGATPCCITCGSILDKKKRDAISDSFEWRPSSTFKLVADGLFTRLRDPQIGYNQSYYFVANPDGTPWRDATFKNGQITEFTADFFQPEMVNNTTDRVVDTSLFGLKATWSPNDQWSFKGDLYRSKADRPEGGNDTFVTAGLTSSTPNAQDTLVFNEIPNSLPNINVFVPPKQLGLSSCPQGTISATDPSKCSFTALMNSGFLNNNKYWSTHYVGLNGYSVQDRVTGFTLDGSYTVGSGLLSKVLFGIGESRRERTCADVSNDWTNGSGQYGSLYNTLGAPAPAHPYTCGSQGFNVIFMVNLPNFMQGAGGSYPTTLPQLNVSQLLAYLKGLDGKINPASCLGDPQCPGAS